MIFPMAGHDDLAAEPDPTAGSTLDLTSDSATGGPGNQPPQGQESAPGSTLPGPDFAVGVFAELATIVLPDQPLSATLVRIAQIAAEVIPGADEVSITLIQGEKARSVAFSGQLAAALDERQYRRGFGPCMDAAASGTVIATEDTFADKTYPDFAREAARAGVRHSLSIPVPSVADGRTGAMNIYGSGIPLDAGARDVGTTFATYAAVAMANAAVYAGVLEHVEQMKQALASRAFIEQAKGIIMARQRCDAEEAFELLRSASNRGNRKLRDIAQSIVTSTTG